MTDIRSICNLSDAEFAARREELRAGLFQRARGREELPDGLALLFDATRGMREALEAFVTFERRCCGGLGFEVQDAPGALRLEIRGIDPKTDVLAGVGRATTDREPPPDAAPRATPGLSGARR